MAGVVIECQYLDCLPRFQCFKQIDITLFITHRLIVDGQNDIVYFKSGLGQAAAFLKRGDDNALCFFQAIFFGFFRGNRPHHPTETTFQ